jgi:ribosomal protein S21
MTAAIEPLKTLIREADNGRAGNLLAGALQRMQRPPKNTLAERLERPRVTITPSNRPAHAIVLVLDGNIEGALRLLKRKLDDGGVRRLLKRTSTLYTYYRPGVRRRMKQHAAAQRSRKASRVRRRLGVVPTA